MINQFCVSHLNSGQELHNGDLCMVAVVLFDESRPSQLMITRLNTHTDMHSLTHSLTHTPHTTHPTHTHRHTQAHEIDCHSTYLPLFLFSSNILSHSSACLTLFSLSPSHYLNSVEDKM